MTLTELFAFKKSLENFTVAELHHTTETLQNEASSWCKLDMTDQISQSLSSLITAFDSIHASRLNLVEAQKDLLVLVSYEIENISSKFFTLGYEVNGRKVLGPTSTADDDRNNRKIEISLDFEQELGSRIRQYTNWKYPCVEIGPGDGFWTDNLVGSDPLYLIDIHKEYLDNTLLKYNKKFNQRVRTYLIGPEAGKSEYDASMLPKNQIGFIFSWAVFDFIPYEQAKVYLTSCFESLRPGGVMVFSFNNCDTYEAVIAAENGIRSWMNEKLLKQIFHSSGMELLGFYQSKDLVHHWVEVKKPGSLHSMKTSQPLANIKIRPGFEKVDTEPERQYNKQQIARIKQLAVQLGIDTPEKIMGGAYSPHKLMKLVEIARMNK